MCTKESRSWIYASVVKHLKEAVSSLSAIYVFGSQVSGHARVDNDLDVGLYWRVMFLRF